MNKKFMDATTLLGMGVGLFGILSLMPNGSWQQKAIFGGFVIYLILAIIAIINWYLTDRKFF